MLWVSDAEAIQHLERSPHWGWVALDPESNRLLSIDIDEHMRAMAQRLVHHVVQVMAPGGVPLFLSDGLHAYTTAC